MDPQEENLRDLFTQSIEKQDRIVDELVQLRRIILRLEDRKSTHQEHLHSALERLTTYLERSANLEERIAAIEKMLQDGEDN